MASASVYILRCCDGSLYTGWSTDVPRRLARHRSGSASRYTASRLPVELALVLAMPDRSAAMREEARIKRLDRAAKLALIASREDAPGTSARRGKWASVDGGDGTAPDGGDRVRASVRA
jgi:putative endonuclease